MDKNQSSTTNDQSIRNGLKHKITITLLWCLTFILIIIDLFYVRWIFISGYYGVIKLLGLGVLQFILVISLDRSLYEIQIERALRYRLAFLIGACLPAIYLFVRSLFSQLWIAQNSINLPGIITLIFIFTVSVVSSFLGAIFITWSHDELIEDNLPPGQMKDEVLRLHEEQIVTCRLDYFGANLVSDNFYDLVRRSWSNTFY
jgi:hypothetical protein